MAVDTIRELDRFAASLLGNRLSLRQMPMDLYRVGDKYVLTADLPGVTPESIDIDIDGRQLTIRAEREFENLSDLTWITRERSEGAFVRQLTIGEAIDTDDIQAEYDNGVLTVTMPIRESAKPRKVTVNHVSGADKVAISGNAKSD